MPIWFVKCLHSIFPFLCLVGEREIAKIASPWDSEIEIIQQLQRKPENKANIFSKSVPWTKHIGFVEVLGNFPSSYINLVDKWESPRGWNCQLVRLQPLLNNSKPCGPDSGAEQFFEFLSEFMAFPVRTLIPVQWYRQRWVALRPLTPEGSPPIWMPPEVVSLTLSTASYPFTGIDPRCHTVQPKMKK